jgi:hypothetical protein
MAHLTDCPALFAEFRGKRFALPWRGSRDGFGCGTGNSDPKAIFRKQIRAEESTQFPISICTEG